ncbi:hypothetical protein [Nonomuraea sp. LPB2021202275-12-8]|uniref:hypothetical protein n=1 Tax=Nonomuraea sp. LPB2021202275-12-8 TaxID=3120159 RepID=UPI00300CD0F0
MNPWQEVLERIEAGANQELAEFVSTLGELGRKAVAVQLPGHVAGRLGEGMDGRREIEDQAAGLRIAGAACLGGAAQVAAWLNRRELRRVLGPRTDAARILSLIRDRPAPWRRELAVRLVGRLRQTRGTGVGARVEVGTEAVPGWHVAAGLVAETGIEPPDGDAFVAGWAWQLAEAHRWEQPPPLCEDPLLDVMVPRLFRSAGVAGALAWSERRKRGVSAIASLAALASQGRVPREVLLGGCAGRFVAGGVAGELTPFVELWHQLRPEPSEIPVLGFVRLLPSAPSPLVRLAIEELRRADEAGLLDDELFADAVRSLALRPEKRYVSAALQWIAEAGRSRADGALVALATVLGEDSPALRDRAARLRSR